MKISIIVAIAKNNEIGRNNDMLAHLPIDLKHFKNVTSNHSVIMGRKTFESLPKGALPNRRNIVISRNDNLEIPGAEVVPSLDRALMKVKDEDEVFIIGGAQIYKQALPIADKLYLTRIHAEFPEADTFFPEIIWNEWILTSDELFPADDKNPYTVRFQEWLRC